MPQEVTLLVFRSHGWLVRYDGEQWVAVDATNTKVVGAEDIIYRIAASAAMARESTAAERGRSANGRQNHVR